MTILCSSSISAALTRTSLIPLLACRRDRRWVVIHSTRPKIFNPTPDNGQTEGLAANVNIHLSFYPLSSRLKMGRLRAGPMCIRAHLHWRWSLMEIPTTGVCVCVCVCVCVRACVAGTWCVWDRVDDIFGIILKFQHLRTNSCFLVVFVDSFILDAVHQVYACADLHKALKGWSRSCHVLSTF